MVWQEETLWQVERMGNFGPNVVSFLLTSVSRRWYFVGEYMPLNDAAAVHQVEKELGENPKGI